MLRPCGERVCNLEIRKSSLCFKRLQVFKFDNDLLATHLFNDSKLSVSIEILTWDFKNAYHTVDHLFFKRHFYVFLFLI